MVIGKILWLVFAIIKNYLFSPSENHKAPDEEAEEQSQAKARRQQTKQKKGNGGNKDKTEITS